MKKIISLLVAVVISAAAVVAPIEAVAAEYKDGITVTILSLPLLSAYHSTILFRLLLQRYLSHLHLTATPTIPPENLCTSPCAMLSETENRVIR